MGNEQKTGAVNGAADKNVLCIGIIVLDILASPIGAAETWREKQRIESIALQVGGDAANQCIHMAALGCHPFLCGCVGADTNGDTLRSTLQRRGVDDRYLRIRSDISTGTALLLIGADGERTVFSVKGAHSTLCRKDLPEEVPENCAAISLASLFSMPLLEEDGLEEFLKKARSKGIPVFADLDSGHVVPGVERVEKYYPLIDYFLPSSYDLELLTGRKGMEDCVSYLKERGVGEVIVKCGERGCRVFSRDFQGQIPAAAVKPVDTTGAGDCMTAAFISRILSGDQIEDACRYACAAGSLNTLYPGASTLVLTDKAVRELMTGIR